MSRNRRSSSDRDADFLAVGDECWLLDGTLLYEVTITEVRNIDLGETAKRQLTMYRIEAPYYHLKEESQHRSDLFRRPSEVEELRERIESDINSLNYMLQELEDVGVAEDEP